MLLVLKLIAWFYQIDSFDIETAGDVTVVGGILRVSTKYEVRDLRSRAIHALRKSYPTSFTEYQSAVKGAHFTPKICPERRIYVVNLICETNTLILLPAALLFCCWSKTQDLLGGVMFNGCTTVTLLDFMYQRLDRDQFCRCVIVIRIISRLNIWMPQLVLVCE